MTYHIHALPLSPFQSWFALSDSELELRGARRMVATEPNSSPCRVSLKDAEPGECLILLNHRHLDAPLSPYHSNGPIFVREAAEDTLLAADTLPAMLTRRLLSMRAYDTNWMMIKADVTEGADLDTNLRDWFANPDVTQIHLHTARRGCFMAVALRSTP